MTESVGAEGGERNHRFGPSFIGRGLDVCCVQHLLVEDFVQWDKRGFRYSSSLDGDVQQHFNSMAGTCHEAGRSKYGETCTN